MTRARSTTPRHLAMPKIDPDARYRIVDTWNGGKGGRVIRFTSNGRGAAGHNECFVWVHRNTSFSFYMATTQQGYVCEPVPLGEEPRA